MSTAPTKITGLSARDIRFPTSLTGDGSDAMHDPDYSCAYVVVKTDSLFEGYGLTFTLGRGTHIVCSAIDVYRSLVIGRKLKDIFHNFGSFWNELTQESQLRWLGPEKGVTHIALAGIINAIWDLWARVEGKPLWKLLVDMEPETLISTIDFTYISDALKPEEALEILKKGQSRKEAREAEMLTNGYPAYTTSAGWLGYSDEKIGRLCKEALTDGFTRFKVKVGQNIADDQRRVAQVRQQVGPDAMVMVDANQRWGVEEAIEWVKQLASYNLTWIEEPTSPDDILGHLEISKALKPLGIGVATGEHCQNRVMFKQFLSSGALQFCQIDTCRLAGPNEMLSVILMAAKFGVPICPHAGGVGLCELAQHMSLVDYIIVSGTLENRVLEFVDHLHEHFVDPVVLQKGCYIPPKMPGYSAEMKPESLEANEFPAGSAWQKLFKDGVFNQEMYKL